MSSLNDGYRTAIILQSGGALGAYELGVLKALYETRPPFRTHNGVQHATYKAYLVAQQDVTKYSVGYCLS
jgi:hypothetical protein